MRLVTNEFAPLKQVSVKDGFWSRYQEIAREKIIPFQWRAINDDVPGIEPSHAIRNFRIAAGLEEGDFGGLVFQDSDVAKWLEAVAYRLSTHPDPELEKTADGVIDLIAQAQEEDGYLDTFFQIAEPDRKFTNLNECHELYCAGHMTEAAVAYYEATGKDKLLNVMRRCVDLIDRTIGPEEGKLHGYPGHPELELALCRLYRATGEERYLKLCAYMINERGTEPFFFEEELKKRGYTAFWGGGRQEHVDKEYNQAHKPLKKQTEAIGHSVRAGYLYTGAADLAAETGDGELARAMETLWNNVVNRQMYITGAVGSQVHGEAFSFDYHLPNDTVYGETCAAISMVFFASRMLRMDSDRKYADVMERLLYNGTISGMALDGQHFFYTNPLAMWEEATKRAGVTRHIRSKRPGWFGCACCPPNLARMITSLGGYVYSSSDDTAYVHLYVGSDAELDVGGQTVKLSQTGNYPWDGRISFKPGAGKYRLALRIPGWARTFSVTVNGAKVSPGLEKGYAVLDGVWEDGDEVILDLPMPVEFVEANPLLRADNGRVAIMRGPVVYCLESADNGEDLDALQVVCADGFRAEEDGTLFPGMVKLVGPALRRKPWNTDALYRRADCAELEECEITAIPYAFWDNREDTREMIVWIRK
ncbi:MAG: glycoside hydrolase family 127 protein [Ruminococcaceae bacterium]|jgi:hypothetical protein|nr:glycoside hydrolase family 127 protein [Oscillospiraceae bacterium]